ncbi:Hypothetical protein RMHFA_05612 (plasmid) [Roseomonas mucosa]|nr:Hypothetical protein RMHFA_05612 [Roseomonas mucosa]
MATNGLIVACIPFASAHHGARCSMSALTGSALSTRSILANREARWSGSSWCPVDFGAYLRRRSSRISSDRWPSGLHRLSWPSPDAWNWRPNTGQRPRDFDQCTPLGSF